MTILLWKLMRRPLASPMSFARRIVSHVGSLRDWSSSIPLAPTTLPPNCRRCGTSPSDKDWLQEALPLTLGALSVLPRFGGVELSLDLSSNGNTVSAGGK